MPSAHAEGIGRITLAGSIKDYPIGVLGLAAGFGKWLWFTDPTASTVGRMST